MDARSYIMNLLQIATIYSHSTTMQVCLRIVGRRFERMGLGTGHRGKEYIRI